MPMVLVGQEHWLRRYPAWPLLQSLAAGRQMENRIFLVDTVEEALAVLDRVAGQRSLRHCALPSWRTGRSGRPRPGRPGAPISGYISCTG